MTQPETSIDEVFKSMGSARAMFTKPKYLHTCEGTYILRVDEVSYIPKAGTLGKGFKIEFTVIAVVAVPDGGKGHRPGEHVSWMQTEGKYPDSFESRIKTALCAILAKEEDQIDASTMKEILGEPSAMAGYCTEARVFSRPKKDQPLGVTIPVMTSVVNFQRFVPGEEIKAILKDAPAQLLAILYPNGIDAPLSTEV